MFKAVWQRQSVRIFSSTCVLLVVGCNQSKSEPAPAVTQQAAEAPPRAAPLGTKDEPVDPPKALPAQEATASAAIVWTKPETWSELPARPMRQATYQAIGAKGPAEIAIFYFGPDGGGGVEANITRWVGQFPKLPPAEARRESLEINGFRVAQVRVQKGTFSSGMPGGPAREMADWGMNAAVVETPSGAYFFKMTGPAATVTAEEPHFAELLRSIKSKS